MHLADRSLTSGRGDPPALLIGNHLHFFRVGLQSKEMTTLIITVNLECCRCSSKIQKILCSIQQEGEFVIEKIVYEKDKVMVTGPFDADKLTSKLWCKAGRIIKNIEVAKPPPKTEPKPKPEPPQCKLIYPYYPYFPCPEQPGAWPCSCGSKPHCGCHPKPPPEPAPAPQPPPPPLKPPACQCPTWTSCYCSGYPPPYLPSYPMIVCDDTPPYGACTVM